MRRSQTQRRRGRLAAVLGVMIAVLQGATASAGPAELFVSSAGSDLDPGTAARPFRSLERARDAVRGLRRRNEGLPRGGVTVWLRAGTYRRVTSFVLDSRDSGSAASPVVYRARPGEAVRVIGGISIGRRSIHPVADPAVLRRLDPAARGHVLEADLRALGLTDLGGPLPPKFRGYGGWPELFIDGKPMRLARWPNEGFARVASVVDPGSKPRWKETPDRPGTFVYTGDRPSRWTNAPEVYLDGYWAYKWYNESLRVGRIDPATRQITFVVPSMYGVGGPSGGEYYAYNLLEELDAPGEYYVDRSTGRIYFWPPTKKAGREIGLSLLEAPLISIKDAAYVTLRGITFELSRGSAVTVDGGSHDLVASCTVRNIATDAITIAGGHDNGVRGCELYDLGGGGVSLSGGDRAALTPCRNVADNNHIHHFGRLFRTHHDAVNLNGVGCRASHNLIHDAPHHAIDFGGNDHVIEFNEIHHVCLETDDAGAIYTGRNWTVRGTVIRYNLFHDIGGGPSVGNQAIYLDDTACGTVCYGNIVSRVHRAFLIGGGRDNVVRNNVIVECSVPVHIDNRGMGGEWAEGQEVWLKLRDDLKEVPYQGDAWRKRYPQLANILSDEPGLPKGNVVERNVMVRCGPMSLAREASAHSTIAGNWETNQDPGFVDAAHFDFALRPGNELLRRLPRFEPLPVRAIGPYVDAYRGAVPLTAPSIEPAGRRFVGSLLVEIRGRQRGAVIRYTLDGSEPTRASPAYQGCIRLLRSTTVTAAAFARGAAVRSDLTIATFVARRLSPGSAVYLSELPPVEAFVHGSMLCDTAYEGGSIRIGGRSFQRGVVTHPEVAPTGGKAEVTWALPSGPARARRFKASIGVDDSARGRGSVTFSVQVRRRQRWTTLFTSGVYRGGQADAPGAVDVDISGADRLRLVVTDAGDGIDSDHAAWGDARVE